MTVDGTAPTALSSWRGDYSELAIECDPRAKHLRTELGERGKPFEMNLAGYGTYTPGYPQVNIKADPVVADLVRALDLAVGREFEGYKGGQYLMRWDTRVWVSNYGCYETKQVAGFAPDPKTKTVNLVTHEVGY